MDLLAFATVFGAGLLGSVPFGYLLAKRFFGLDLKAIGSGNIGATNATRAGGAGLGAFVLLLDALKGAAGPLIAQALGADAWTVVLAGLAAVVSHCYTPFLRFAGGKGVATSLGVIVAIDPWLGLAGVLAYALTLAATRTSAIGSLVGTGLCVLIAWLWPGDRFDWPAKIILLVLCALIVWRHRSNIAALRSSEGVSEA